MLQRDKTPGAEMHTESEIEEAPRKGSSPRQQCVPESPSNLQNYPLTPILYIYTVLSESAAFMSSELTQRQQQIVAFLEDFQREHGMMPTCKEIAEAFGFRSPNAVTSHLDLLAKKGAIERMPGKARGLRLFRAAKATGIPLLGEIAAGDPVLAAEASGEYLPVSEGLFAGSKHFAVRVNGHSMIEKGIFEGDFAVIRAQTDVDDGEIAAVLLDDEATLKMVLRRDSKCIVLRGANPSFKDIVIREGDAVPRILGKYVGLIRRERRVA